MAESVSRILWVKHDGHLGAQVPLDFLSLTQRTYFVDAQGRLRTSLYKALLFLEMATAVKSDQLNFTCCYQYRAFEYYLLPATQWAKHREALLEQAGLSAWRDFATVQATLQAQLQAQFAATNAHLTGADNPHAHRTPAGRYRLTTPRLPPEQQAAVLATLSPFAVLSCRHVNLHGEYDFSDQPPPAEAPFDMDLIATWQPPSKPA